MKNSKAEDLLQRTFNFGIAVGKFLSKQPYDNILRVYFIQLAKSSSSVGANYEEAQAAESKKDFIHKVCIALKEARESNYWLRFVKIGFINNEEINTLTKESEELIKILFTIVSTTKSNLKN